MSSQSSARQQQSSSPTRSSQQLTEQTPRKSHQQSQLSQVLQGSLMKKLDDTKQKNESEKRQQEEIDLQRQKNQDLLEMKQHLFGLVEEIVQRQDEKSDILSMQSFKIETASRKVLSDLLQFFQTRDDQHEKNVVSMKQQVEKYMGRVDSLEKLIKKVQQSQLDTDAILKKVNKLETKQDIAAENSERQLNNLKDMINMVKGQFDNKLEVINVYDQKFTKMDKEITKLRELIHAFRDQQASEINEERLRIGKLDQFMNGQIDKLQLKIDNNKYFLTKMNESINSLDTQVATFNTKLTTTFDRLDSENERRLLIEDFKKSMKQVNEFLLIKFRDQDDMKNAMRDAFTFIKLYSPMQTQMMINENLNYLVKNQQSNNDMQFIDEERYYAFMQTKLDSLLQNIMLEKSRAEKLQGEIGRQVIGDQLNEVLIKYALPKEETGKYGGNSNHKPYKSQSQQIEIFMSDLIKQQIDDARLRLTKQKLFSGGYVSAAEQLRTGVNLMEIQEMIDRVESKTEQQLKKSKKQSEQIINKRREQEEIRKRQLEREAAYKERIQRISRYGDDKNIDKKKLLRKTRSEVNLAQDVFNMNTLIKKQQRNPSRIAKLQQQEGFNLADQDKEGQDLLINSQENMDIKMENIMPYMDQYARTISLQKEDFQNFLASEYKMENNDNVAGNSNNDLFKSLDKSIDTQHQDKQGLQQQPMNIIEEDSKHQIAQQQKIADVSNRSNTKVQYVNIDEQTQKTKLTNLNTYNFNEDENFDSKNRRVSMNDGFNTNFSPGKLTKVQRKKLVQDLKEEIQAIMASSIELKVSEQTSSIMNQIRKIEMDIMTQNHRANDRFTKDLDDARSRFRQDFQDANAALIEDIKYLKKQRARDKSDFDLQIKAIREKMKGQKKQLQNHSSYFESIAQIMSMTLESLNMQIFSEEQDTKDKQKMALVGAKDKYLKIQELHGTTHDKINKQVLLNQQQNELHEQSNSTQMGNFNSTTARSNSNDSNHLRENQTSQLLQHQLNQTSKYNYSTLSGATQQNLNNTSTNLVPTKITKKVKIDYPIKLEQNCLSCQVSGHDTQQILQMFKIACIAYQPSSIKYRQKKLTREHMMTLRKQLMEKCIGILQRTNLFKSNALYPKRYFDDLVIEDSLMQNSLLLASNRNNQSIQIDQPEPQNLIPLHSSYNTATLAFGIGQKQDYNQAIASMNHTTSTFINDSEITPHHLDTKYQLKDSQLKSKSKPVKAVQGLSLSIKKDPLQSSSKKLAGKFGERNLSIQNDQLKSTTPFKANFTTRNLNISTIDHHCNTENLVRPYNKNIPSTSFRHNQSNMSFDSQLNRKIPNFDIEEIIKNPNAEIKKYTKAYHLRIQSNQSPAAMLNSNQNIVYPNISHGGRESSLQKQKKQQKEQSLTNNSGFQDLPKIK